MKATYCPSRFQDTCLNCGEHTCSQNHNKVLKPIRRQIWVLHQLYLKLVKGAGQAGLFGFENIRIAEKTLKQCILISHGKHLLPISQLRGLVQADSVA